MCVVAGTMCSVDAVRGKPEDFAVEVDPSYAKLFSLDYNDLIKVGLVSSCIYY